MIKKGWVKKLLGALCAGALIAGVTAPALCGQAAEESPVKTRASEASGAVAAFRQNYAKAGAPLEAVVENAPEDLRCSYTWSVDGKVVAGETGSSYTPTEADKEKFIQVTVKAENYENMEWTLQTYMSDLPVVYIDTEDGQDVLDKNYHDAKLRLQGNDEYPETSVLYDGAAEIKGRGNSTWDYAVANGLKKPFKIKLDKKADILGMGKNKHWVLLANAIDHTNMRNQLMFEFAEEIGMQCIMETKPVVLVMNGEYVGFYELCEHKRVDEGRIDVFDWEGLGEDIATAVAEAESFSKEEASLLEEQMTLDFSWVDTGKVLFGEKTYRISDYYKEEIPEFTGGFALDMDFRIDDPKNISKFRTKYGYPMIFEAPEYAKTSTKMMEYVQTYLQAFEDAIHADDFYVPYNGEEVYYGDLYDMESLIQNWYLVEYSMNWDAMKNSTLMYKDLDGKLTMGPAWDFDWCWGNINMYSMTAPSVITGWHTTEDSFCEQSYQRENWNRYLVSDPYFMTLAYEKWQEIRPTVIEDMIKDGGKIDRLTESYRAASEANDAKWAPTYNKYSGYKIAPDGSKEYVQSELYEDAVASMKNFIKLRVAWMDKQFESLDTLLASLGRYQASDRVQITEITPTEDAKNEITVEVADDRAVTAVFYVNGIRAGKEKIKNGVAKILVDDAMLRDGENKTNTVQVRVKGGSGEFLKKDSKVMTNYKNFQKTKQVPQEPPVTVPFEDVEEGDWFYDAVAYNFANKYMQGKDDTHFAPYENLVRAQFAVILHRIEGEPATTYDHAFPDVADGEWYTDAILWAAEKKIVTGYTDSGRFGTADDINREQMAVMMYRYAQYRNYDVDKKADFSHFEDADSVSGYAKEAMRWAVGAGIITGKYEGTTIDPQGKALRAECAIIIARFMQFYQK